MRLEKLGEAGNETAWQKISQGAVASSQMSPECIIADMQSMIITSSEIAS